MWPACWACLVEDGLLRPSLMAVGSSGPPSPSLAGTLIPYSLLGQCESKDYLICWFWFGSVNRAELFSSSKSVNGSAVSRVLYNFARKIGDDRCRAGTKDIISSILRLAKSTI
jgi:hypothetical protein